MQLEEWREQFAGLGINVAGMTYDELGILAEFHAAENLGFPLLKDENARHVNALGIRNEDYDEGHRAYGIPHPGILLISPDGQIKAKYAVPGYRRRPPFKALYGDVEAALR